MRRRPTVGTEPPADLRQRRLAAACPGQGVDPRDVAAVLERCEEDPLVQRLADWSGGRRWADADLTDTRLAQPAVFVASVAAGRRSTLPWTATIGHSLGELAAAVLAGALDAQDGFDLVRARAELGHRCDERRPGRMIVVMRLDGDDVEWIRRAAIGATDGVLELAVANGPGQIVLSGDRAAADAAIELADQAGGVARALPIGGGYHTPLLAGAVDELHERIRGVARTPTLPLISSTACRSLRSSDEVALALARSLVLPVRWERAVAVAAETGVDHLIDVGPGTTLANLARHAPLLPTTPLAELD